MCPPSLDDLPTLAPLTTVTGDDLLPIYDLTGNGSSKVRKIALNQINGLSSSDVVTAPSGATTVTITSRLTILNGLSSGAVTATLPDPTGTLREVIIQNANTSTSTLTVASPSASTLFTAASVSGVTSVSSYTNNNQYRFMSNGTNWYRVH